MDINVSCEKCKDELEIVKEYTERGSVEITVNPCVYCLDQATQQAGAVDGLPASVFENPETNKAVTKTQDEIFTRRCKGTGKHP